MLNILNNDLRRLDYIFIHISLSIQFLVTISLSLCCIFYVAICLNCLFLFFVFLYFLLDGLFVRSWPINLCAPLSSWLCQHKLPVITQCWRFILFLPGHSWAAHRRTSFQNSYCQYQCQWRWCWETWNPARVYYFQAGHSRKV